MRDPILYTDLEDKLPEGHPLAYKSIYCDGQKRKCDETLHALDDECTTAWVETGKGNFCLPCFLKLSGLEAVGFLEDDSWGLLP